MYENTGDKLIKDLENSLHSYGIVNEVYVGKTPGLLKAEQAMEEICQFIKDREEGKAKGKVMKQKAYKDLVRALSNEYEIDRFELIFTDSAVAGKYPGHQSKYSSLPKGYMATSAMNMYGSTSVLLVDDIKNLVKNIAFKSGKSDKLAGKKSVCIFLQAELVTTHGLNAQEMMSVLLHELGHSFTMNYIMVISLIFTLITSPMTFLSIGWRNFYNSSLFISTARFANMIMPQFLSNILRSINKLITPYLQAAMPMLRLADGLKYFYKLLFDTTIDMKYKTCEFNKIIANMLSGYANERYSDSFATTYGYGVDLTSAIRKISYLNDSTISKMVPGSDTTSFDMLYTMSEFISAILDPHPSTISRVSNQINKLKRDLNSIEDPQLKATVQKQIEAIQELYDNFYTKENQTTEMNRYLKVLDKIFKGQGIDLQSISLNPYYQMQEL